jgi:cardiolipin synthase A/B
VAVGLVRRSWKVALAFVVGVGLTFAALFVWSQRYAVKPKATFEISLAATPDLGNALYQALAIELRPGHTIEVVRNGAVFDRIVAEVAKAKHSVDIVMYIWEAGAASTTVTTALAARAHGVACRIVVDAFGSPTFDLVRPALVAAGCELRTFRPLPGIDPIARDHRKIFVFDNRVAIIGGLGVRDDWMGDGLHGMGWRDTGAVFSGPAVREAHQAFAENWQEAGGPLLPADELDVPPATGAVTAAWISSTSSTVVTRAERLTQIVIAQARHRLWITNAYLAPSPAILDLLERKAASGVDVRLLVPGDKSDVPAALRTGRELYPRLRKAGVRIWEYLPVMIHAKTMLADDDLTVIGSINLDPLSLNKLDEDALLAVDPVTAKTLANAFTEDCTHAKEIVTD